MAPRVPLPASPHTDCTQPHVIRNGSKNGRKRFHCRGCGRFWGSTQGTPMYGLRTSVAEIAQALLIVQRRGSLRAAEELTGHTYETIGTLLRTGRRGRPRLGIPPTLRRTQPVNHWECRGRLPSGEVVAALGTRAEVVPIERVNGLLRNRRAALTRRTHAFAKRDATWDALLALAIFDHNGIPALSAFRSPSVPTPCSPAMTLGLTDHL